MTAFTRLEEAALRAIFAETPGLARDLERQLERASVVERENTGGGFITTIEVADDAPRIAGPGVLGYETLARVEGLEHGLGFVLFLKKGRLHLLDTHSWGPESTAQLDPATLAFEIFNAPIDRGFEFIGPRGQ
jgi:hypothetical protein